MIFPVARTTGICLLLFLSACSTQPVQERPPASSPQPPPAAVTRPEPTPQPEQPAVTAHRQLLTQADRAMSQGDYDTALALLERAQRIDPQDGLIYLNLARTYRASGDDRRAVATAERGLLYCNGAAQCDALRQFVR